MSSPPTAALGHLSPICADLHIHSKHSHGQDDIFSMYAAAQQKGLRIIGFSEHSPRPTAYTYKEDYQKKLRSSFQRYLEEVRSLQKETGKEGPQVLLGVEIDYIPEEEAYVEKLCSAERYDYIIGGLHFQNSWGFDGPAEQWEGLNRAERFSVYSRYYQDLARMCQTGLFQIAAHPDLVKLHSIHDFHLWLQTDQALELIETALSTMKQHKMALEISSAGLRKPCQEVYPNQFILQRAAALGVPISFGSDAHCKKTLAFAFDHLAIYAARHGYSEHLIFIDKIPHSLSFICPDVL